MPTELVLGAEGEDPADCSGGVGYAAATGGVGGGKIFEGDWFQLGVVWVWRRRGGAEFHFGWEV